VPSFDDRSGTAVQVGLSRDQNNTLSGLDKLFSVYPSLFFLMEGDVHPCLFFFFNQGRKHPASNTQQVNVYGHTIQK